MHDQEDSGNMPSKSTEFKSLSKVDTKTDQHKNVSSRERIRKTNEILNVQSFDEKQYNKKCQIISQSNALHIKDKRKTLLATYLHQDFGWQCMEAIVKTAKLGQMTGIPKDIEKYDVKCSFCVSNSIWNQNTKREFERLH